MTRSQGEHLKKGETRQKIIEFIVSSPSLVVEEPELRDYLKKKHDIREPKNIKRLLKDLSKRNLITKEEIRGHENKWSIENVIQLQRIIIEYNDITINLQKNDKIISMLIDQHFQQPYYFKESYKLFNVYQECDKCLKSSQKPDGIDCNFNEEERKKCIEVEKKMLSDKSRYLNVRQISVCKEMENNIENAVNNFDSKFKDYLKISPCFFKMCLKTPAEFENTFKRIFKLTMKERPIIEMPFENCMSIEEGHFKYYDNVFEICVHTDIINNEASEKAIEYVYNMKRNTKELDKSD